MPRRHAAAATTGGLALLFVACAHGKPEPAAQVDDGLAEAITSAAVGVGDAELQVILRDHWTWRLEQSPLGATKLGVHTWDDRIDDGSPAAEAARARMRRELVARLEALGELSDEDRLTAAVLAGDLRADIREEVCGFERWLVNATFNPIERANEIGRIHPMSAAHARSTLLARVRAVPAAIDLDIARLRVGLGEGLVGDAPSIERVIAMIDGQLDTPTAKWALFEAVARSPGDRGALARELTTAVDDGIRPALGRYRALLQDTLLPKARPSAKAGIGALPQGAECYAALIERHTTLPLTAEDVHARGLAEIARIDAEIAALGQRALGTKDLSTTLTALRSDPKLFFDTPEAVEQAAADALARAQAAMPRFFGRLPKAPCFVRRVPAYKAAFTTIGYYEPPHTDGSKPGEYFINVLDPQTRPRYEARVLAVHESIPGHHLQIAIAQELTGLPAVRRHAGHSAFVEGWALYTERLADEMGLYETDLDRLGMLSFDAWRAARLVVDTGIHSLGWSREEAERFMLEHTALAPNNIANEVDRYVGWPGQALGYKIGQLEILALRAEAQAKLGEDFTLPAFHDALLGAGALPLPALRERVQTWVRETAR